ncbi:MAG: superoxide dismutase [Oscillospiraceae bacterium]|nr:superoxide dismutase [Oscillospiraceae bacterium]
MTSILGINSSYPFTLPPLPYPYDALEPHIDQETMHLHHDKHFATYIKNLNDALKPYPHLQSLSLEQILCCKRLPLESRVKILENAGGVYNHAIFFSNLAPMSEKVNTPEGELLEAIEGFFGSFEEFKEQFSKSAADVFGSGWTILAADRAGNLSIRNVANQEVLLCEGLEPVILFDVWEHAYYLKYKNVRADYVKNLWEIVRFR